MNYKKKVIILFLLFFSFILGHSSLAYGTWTRGEINEWTLTYGGTDYIQDETVYCSGGATFRVDSVDENGSITSLTMLLIGESYNINQIVALFGNHTNATITIISLINYNYYPPELTNDGITNDDKSFFTANATITSTGGEQNSVLTVGFAIMEGNTGEPMPEYYQMTPYSETPFYKIFTVLKPATNYRIRPFAQCLHRDNDDDFGYGETITYMTLGEPPVIPPEYSTASTTTNMIETISYIATTTILTASTTLTVGTYTVSFFLYFLVLSVFMFSILICYFLYNLVKKRKWN